MFSGWLVLVEPAYVAVDDEPRPNPVLPQLGQWQERVVACDRVADVESGLLNSGVEVALRHDLLTARQRPTSSFFKSDVFKKEQCINVVVVRS